MLEPPEDFYDEAAHTSWRADDATRYLLGIYDPKRNPDLVPVDRQFTSRSVYLHREAYAAFQRMHAAAEADGIRLTIVSGVRTFDHQKWIWNNKWARFSERSPDAARRAIALEVLEYSAMPATSRHHWGTDVDLNELENKYFLSGDGKRVYEWLVRNASRFGFCQVYTSKDDGERTGYSEERWHWSYVPLASQLLVQYLSKIDNAQIRDFSGDDLVEELEIRQLYVAGIASACVPRPAAETRP